MLFRQRVALYGASALRFIPACKGMAIYGEGQPVNVAHDPECWARSGFGILGSELILPAMAESYRCAATPSESHAWREFDRCLMKTPACGRSTKPKQTLMRSLALRVLR